MQKALKVPAGTLMLLQSVDKKRKGVMKKNLLTPVASLIIGIALFAVILKFVGVQSIISSVRQFSPSYFVPFMAVTISLFVAATYRWKVVLDGEGACVPFFTLLKYKLMVFGINYLTPVARLGGEPFKVILLKSQHVKSSKAFASVVLDNFIGMGFDAVLGGLLLIAIFFTSSVLPMKLRGLLLALGLVAMVAVAVAYLLLIKKKGIFSYALRVAGALTSLGKRRFFVTLCRKVIAAEFYIRKTLKEKPKQVLSVAFFAALGWPLSVLQYKYALLMLGADAQISHIVIMIAVLTLTTLLPIPASLGIQEAGQFSAFGLLGRNPSLGVALSFVLRLKDLILLNISFSLLSLEGFSLIRIIKTKIYDAFKNGDKKQKKTKRKK